MVDYHITDYHPGNAWLCQTFLYSGVGQGMYKLYDQIKKGQCLEGIW